VSDAVVLDLAEARERRAQAVRLLGDAILLRLAGIDIGDHLAVLASLPLFAEFTVEAA